MDLTMAKTIEGLSGYVKEEKPDLIVVHGDRVEALAGAIVGALNNILVAHIEGGEVSGTIDELIRHSVSKMSHIHFVSNEIAKKRLVQMGEKENCIYTIGSPDVDVMLSDTLPTISEVKTRYDIQFEKFGLVLFHPVTTENEFMYQYAKQFVDALISSNKNYIVVYPNNDLGSNLILLEYKRLEKLPNFKIYPSVRFEYFLVLLKYSHFIIGNSSAGIREAPYYGIPTINIGTRQQNRAIHNDIINCDYTFENILECINNIDNFKFEKLNLFGKGSSDKFFMESLLSEDFWVISKQKVFKDI
jgi:UDP-N-acetylglucosamine 2-epimerase (hydrolysing)